MASIAKYRQETFWAIASKGAAFVFYFALIFILARKMTVQFWGEWSAFFALLNIFLLTSEQGINVASKRYIAQARDTSDLPGVVRATFILRIVASLAYVAAISFLIGPLLDWLHQSDQIGLMQRSLLLIALYGVMDYFKNLFEALHRLRLNFLVNFLEHGFKLLLVVVLFHGNAQFLAIVIAFTIAVGIALAAGVLIALRQIPGILTAPPPSRIMGQTYIYSLPVFLISIGGVVALEIDTIMLKFFRSAYDTGVYSAAKNIVMYLPHLSLALSMGTIPGLSVFDVESAATKRRIYYQILAGLIAVYLLIVVGVIVFALFGVAIFFKPEYWAASTPLLILTPFVLFAGVSAFSGTLLDYRGLAWKRSLNFSFTILTNVLLNWWLIPTWGAAGAAAASSIAFAPYCVLNVWQAHRAFAEVESDLQET